MLPEYSSIVPFLIVIAGPTASGKSGLAMALADRLEASILSADSRQVYCEFDIGTAKPTQAEQRLVPHYLIDICPPTKTLTVADYQQLAQTTLQQIQITARRIPLLVGGTGLYINAIAKGLLIPQVAPQYKLRSQLQALGQPQCYAFLQQLDPVAAQRIHANDAVRTLRALEVYYVTGQPISAQQGENPPPYPILSIGLDSEHLGQRIERRIHHMMDMGFRQEVETLVNRYGPDLSLLKTLVPAQAPVIEVQEKNLVGKTNMVLSPSDANN